jgi:hypothetical protein
MPDQHCRSGRHTIRDRASNGGCRFCATDNGRRYRRTLQDSRRRLAAIEALIA